MRDLYEYATKLGEYKDWLQTDFKVGFEEKLGLLLDKYAERLNNQQYLTDGAKEEIKKLYDLMDDIRDIMEE